MRVRPRRASTGRSTCASIPRCSAAPPSCTDLVGDAARARERLGWAPELDFEQLAHLLVDADVERLQAPATSMERR